VSLVEVYWFDDTGRGACRLPASWKLLYRKNDKWVEVEAPSGYGCEGDQYNRAQFKPVTADGMRIEIQLQEKWAGGVHEWGFNKEEQSGKYTDVAGRSRTASWWHGLGDRRLPTR